MSEWSQLINRWIAVLIQIGAVLTVLGLSWNLKDIILDTTLGGSGSRWRFCCWLRTPLFAFFQKGIAHPALLKACNGQNQPCGFGCSSSPP
jgi:hypothetical protein